MREHGGLGTKYVRAVSEPVRLRLVAALDGGPRSIASLARELEIPETRVVREARKLETLGLLGACEVDGRRAYELVRGHEISDAEWDDLPVTLKRSMAAGMVVQNHAMAAAAVDAGGFDSGDMHLTRTAVPAGAWPDVARALREAWDRVIASAEEAEADSAEAARHFGTAVIMLFTSAHDEIVGESPVPEFDDHEASERTYGVVEAINEEMVDLSRSWDRIAALAEKLRTIARAAAALEAAEPAPQATTRDA